MTNFQEKPKKDPSGWINGGFFVLEPEAIKYIESDATYFEQQPLEQLAKEKKLSIFKHDDFLDVHGHIAGQKQS